MNKIKILIILTLLVFITACAPQLTRKSDYNKNFALGKEMTASVGSPMVSVENITWVEGKEWVGLINAPGGWKHFKNASDDSYRQELIYTGQSGDTIHVSYREYRQDMARPAFYQELTYDLSESPNIVFRSTEIEVLDATNSLIKYKVLRHANN